MANNQTHVQILQWVEKLASKPSNQQRHDKDINWRQKAADVIVLQCVHDLLVCLPLLSLPLEGTDHRCSHHAHWAQKAACMMVKGLMC